MKIKLRWNAALEKWVRLDMNGFNQMEFPDCKNFNIKYPDLNKGAMNIYEDPSAIKIGEESL